jgi:hypothetical protein
MFKYSEDVLEHAVKNSISFCDVVRKLGLCRSGGTYAHVKRRIEKLGIDTSHFLGRASNSGSRFKGGCRIRPAEEILVVRNSDRQVEKTANLRRALIEVGVKHECEKCKSLPSWLGNPLTLQVHHKDGNKFNNLKENLCFLCPNCHSQTDNYGYTGKDSGDTPQV